MKKTSKAIEIVLKNRKYFIIFILFTLFFLALFVAIPTLTITGNDLLFQLSTYDNSDYILLIILSLLSGLMFTLQLYKWKYGRKICNSTKSFAGATGVGVSGIFASIVGTAACAGCIAPIITFFGLGFGALSFILAYQFYFSLITILIIFVALYFIAKEI